MSWLSAGTRLQVKYDDGKLYPGTVSKWNADKSRATIEFDDGTVEDVLLGAPGAKAQEGLATHGTEAVARPARPLRLCRMHKAKKINNCSLFLGLHRLARSTLQRLRLPQPRAPLPAFDRHVAQG